MRKMPELVEIPEGVIAPERWESMSEWERVVFASFFTVCKGNVSEALREYREFFKSIEEDEPCQKEQPIASRESEETKDPQYSFDFIMGEKADGPG